MTAADAMVWLPRLVVTKIVDQISVIHGLAIVHLNIRSSKLMILL